MKTKPKHIRALADADPDFECVMVPPPKIKLSEADFESIPVPPTRPMPRIEVGRDNTGNWAVYVEGLPMGMNFHYRKEAKIVADWLSTCDWEAMTKEV